MIVGVDVSSRAIHLAWLQDGKPCRWHQELGGPKTHLIDRLRAIRIYWPMTGPQWYRDDQYNLVPHERGRDVTDIAIEMPFAHNRNAIAALMAVTGIVTRQAPPWARVAWPSSGELRAAIGAKNNKQDAHRAVSVIVFDNPHMGPNMILANWNEHELDALTACIGWTRILEQQEAA